MELGRACEGELIADPAVSPRHLKLVASPVALLAFVDLGSSGTFVNGKQDRGPAVLDVGDVVRFGGSEFEVISRTRRGPRAPGTGGRAAEPGRHPRAA